MSATVRYRSSFGSAQQWGPSRVPATAGQVAGPTPVVVTDSGTGSESSSLVVTVAVTDTATGTDSSAKATVGGGAPVPLSRWRAALAGRASTPARAVFWGDSVTEGQGASSKANRWVNLLRGTLRSAFPVSGVTGGDNYLPPTYGVYASDSTWGGPTATSSSGTGTDQTYAPNLGSRMLELASGASRTYTVTGTSADIVWASNGGTFTWAVDGGGTTSVNTSGTYHVDHQTHITLGSAGSHTVTITATTGPVYFEGLNVFNGDESAGVQVYEAGHTGFKTSDYLTDTTELARMMAFYAPDLVTIELGLNDAINAVSAATFQTNLSTLVGILTALPTVPSIVLVAAYTPAAGTIGGGRVWSDYVDATKAVAAADPTRVGVVDLSALMPQATYSGSGNYSTDGLHPNNTGHATIAGLLFTAVATTPTAADSGAFTESAALVQFTGTSVTDTGAGSEGTTGLVAAAGVTDTGSLSESVSLVVTVTASDAGSGADSSSVNAGATQVTVTDSGSLSEAVSIAVTVTVTDSGTGVDSSQLSQGGNPSVNDTGVLSEAVTISAAVTVTDTGTGGEAAPGVLAVLGRTDTGVGADASTVDQAAGPVVTDTGALVEAVSVSVVMSRTDQGTLSDVGVRVDLTNPPAARRTVGRVRGMRFSGRIKG